MSIKSNLWPGLTQKDLLYLNNPESNFLPPTNLQLFINYTVILFWTKMVLFLNLSCGKSNVMGWIMSVYLNNCCDGKRCSFRLKICFLAGAFQVDPACCID